MRETGPLILLKGDAVIQFFLRHLMYTELTMLILLLIVSIITGWLPFILIVVALFTLWLWWIITSIDRDAKEELRKR